MDTKVRIAMTTIGYTFSDPLILWEALNAAGSNVVSAGGRRVFDGNKRLALLCDAVLKTALLDVWYPTSENRSK